MAAMFKKPIRFYGKHAAIMQKYCKDKGGDQQILFSISNNDGKTNDHFYVFETRIQIYMVAAMLGIIDKLSIEEDNDKTIYSSIMADMVDKQRKKLERIYQYMILTDDSLGTADAKIKKAFSLTQTDEECDLQQHRLENYVRGGLEIIDGYFKDCKTYEDICNAIIEMNSSLGMDNDID